MRIVHEVLILFGTSWEYVIGVYASVGGRKKAFGDDWEAKEGGRIDWDEMTWRISSLDDLNTRSSDDIDDNALHSTLINYMKRWL